MLRAEVAAALAAWPVEVDSITQLSGGWNSRTWLIGSGSQLYVAKLADGPDSGALEAGLLAAEFAAARGLACGPPVRTRGGALTQPVPAGTLALLRYVPGAPPDLSAAIEVRRAGRVLARAHAVLAAYPCTGDPRYDWPWAWVARCLDVVAMPAEVNAAARRAWREVVTTTAEHRLSVSIIHADPGPEAFLLSDAVGDARQDALIDWATTLRGPLLYDLACFAVNTRSAGPQAAAWFGEGYLAAAPQLRGELAYMDSMIRARWVANAIYFAARIERGIERGPGHAQANEDGLAAALAALTAN